MVYISQDPINNVIIGIIAVIFLVYLSDRVIGKSIKISNKLGISQIFIGLTIISIGTSLPEITTHVVASLDIVRGNIDSFIASSTVIGTNIGSDIVQQNFIIGLVGLLAILHGHKIHMKRSFLKKDFLLMIVAAVLLLLFSIDAFISRVEGAVLFFGYILYLWYLWLEEKKPEKKINKIELDGNDKKEIIVDVVHILVGFIVIILSAEYILRVTEFFVIEYGVGGSLIGILVVGIATALPELTTSVTAIMKGATSISIGTLIGSNITNPMFALGLGAMISTYEVPKPIIVFDLPVKIITAIIIMGFFWTSQRLSKKESLILISMYLIYILARIKFFAVDA
ncbi:sodium:calcium antiporter [Candidatus Woesearchaeota archaeon]|nr:sodium:calcium antiporter [Candidatus Woesearchaeota archaeon]